MTDEETDGDGYVMDLRLAPSFDHASSLGRELPDKRRADIPGNKAGIEKYARAGRGGIYLKDSDQHGANPLALVKYGLENFLEYSNDCSA
jgi:hypothetical protein